MWSFQKEEFSNFKDLASLQIPGCHWGRILRASLIGKTTSNQKKLSATKQRNTKVNYSVLLTTCDKESKGQYYLDDRFHLYRISPDSNDLQFRTVLLRPQQDARRIMIGIAEVKYKETISDNWFHLPGHVAFLREILKIRQQLAKQILEHPIWRFPYGGVRTHREAVGLDRKKWKKEKYYEYICVKFSAHWNLITAKNTQGQELIIHLTFDQLKRNLMKDYFPRLLNLSSSLVKCFH